MLCYKYTFYCTILGIIKCNCRADFGGFRCDELLDRCLYDVNGTGNEVYLPSGDEACGTFTSTENNCTPITSAQTYTCRCGPRYKRNLLLPYDNCLTFKDPCDGFLCIHGYCVSSEVSYLTVFMYF